MRDLIIPSDGFAPIRFGEAHLTRFGREFLYDHGIITLPRVAGGSGSYSEYAEKAALTHSVGKTSWTMPTCALALTTVLPTVTSTGATLTEATGATGYVRKAIAGTVYSAASGGGPATIETAEEVAFAAITAGSAVVVGCALCDSSVTGAGNVIFWASVASTTLSSTQTPASISAKSLKFTLS
jgi:hypothetical protein